MSNLKTALLVYLLCLPMVAIAAPSVLTKTEEEKFDSFMNAIYTMNALSGPHPPYICMYSLFWEEYSYPVKTRLEELLEPLTPKERKRIPFDLAVWWVTLEQLGCGDYDPTLIYQFID